MRRAALIGAFIAGATSMLVIMDSAYSSVSTRGVAAVRETSLRRRTARNPLLGTDRAPPWFLSLRA